MRPELYHLTNARTVADMIRDYRPVAGGDGRLPDEIAEPLARVTELTDDELAALEQGLITAAQEQRDADVPDVEVLTEIRDAVTAVRAEGENRATVAAQRAEEVANLMSEIEPAAEAETPPEGEGEGEGTGDGDGTGEGDGSTTEPAEGETPPPAEGETPPATDPATAPAEGEQPTAQAASAATPPTRQSPGAAARHLPARTQPRAPAPQGQTGRTAQAALVASSGSPGIDGGEQYDSMVAAARAMMQRQSTFRGQHSGSREYYPVVSLRAEYPEDRVLEPGASPQQNGAVVASVLNEDAIVAAGGTCAPFVVRYDLENISVSDRPVRDILANFQADRGGIRYSPPYDFTEMDDAVDFWTHADDEDALTNENTRKPCVRIECADFVEAETYAVTKCVTFGNLGARTWPERVADALTSLMAAAARKAERRLLASIADDSTKVTSGEVLGAARDILTTLRRANAYMRNRWRTRDDLAFRCILPAWVRDLMATDLARQLPGDDTISVALAEIEGYFRDMNVNVTWALEGEAGQDFTVQGGSSPLQGWPAGTGSVHTVFAYLFPEGTHILLDGGELDLGLVRDSTLNARNDYNMFSENWEGTAKVGHESLRIDMNVCPDGSTSGAVDINPCAVGS